jgi:hypothetical protein
MLKPHTIDVQAQKPGQSSFSLYSCQYLDFTDNSCTLDKYGGDANTNILENPTGYFTLGIE